MSLDDVLSRVSQLEQLAGLSTTPTAAAAAPAAATLPPVATGASPFARTLAAVLTPTAAVAADGSSTGSGAQLLAAAESQVGVSEQPPGSNDGAQIATYRSAVAGAQPGEPWCAYFASWAAQQAGEPIGVDGQGLGSVTGITDWAQSTGRLLPASATPSPGDLILFGDEHVGIVESVQPDGSLTTVEGNYGNGVTRVHRAASEATGYVQM